MNNKDIINRLLYSKVKRKGFQPSHVAEVGVWHPETSNVLLYIFENIPTTLVEPDPDSIALIKEKFSNLNNVTLHEVAVCDFNGTVELCKRESSTFVSHLQNSPAVVNDDYNIDNSDKFEAKAVTFSEIDDGTIDLISIDTEGSEWFVIKNMTSKPVIISIETHGGLYENPYINELKSWMYENGYVIWYKTKDDSVYVLEDKITISTFDRINLLLSNIGINFRYIKKKLKKKTLKQ